MVESYQEVKQLEAEHDINITFESDGVRIHKEALTAGTPYGYTHFYPYHMVHTNTLKGCVNSFMNLVIGDDIDTINKESEV